MTAVTCDSMRCINEELRESQKKDFISSEFQLEISMSRDTSGDLDEDSSVSRVSAWKNKDEFTLVYDWIFSDVSNDETKRQALERMKIWKIRRLNLTPASVLSTLSILSVQLKDCGSGTTKYADDDLRTMYSEAFLKMMNYMSSIMRSRTVPSMYSTARELGIESFLVDLRHQCAHGQVSPSLDILRRTAAYCMKWLREFYWDREHKSITDASVQDVQLKSSVELEQSVREYFQLYDAASEALALGHKTVADLPEPTQNGSIDASDIELLQDFAAETHQKRLSFIANKAINQLAQLSSSKGRDHGYSDIFCDVLFDCHNFVQRSATAFGSERREDQSKFVGIHQNLFRLFAMCDFINNLFNRLLLICEDDAETLVLRQAASFWANEIATGFTVFMKFKQFYKNKKEKRTDFDIDLATINTDLTNENIKHIYKTLGVDIKGTLIFGDTVRRPWSLHFDRDFLIERALNLNELTVPVIRKCIHLAQPPLDEIEIDQIEKIVSIYAHNDADTMETTTSDGSVEVKVYTLNDAIESAAEAEANQSQTASIWREAPDGWNWKSCPLGSLPWATN